MRNVDLEKEQQARLVELMLVGVVQDYQDSFVFFSASPEIKSIMEAVNQDRILKQWWLDESLSTFDEDQIKLWVQKLVRLFGGPRNSVRRCEWVISYYLLNFIKTYGPSRRFATLILSDPDKNNLLETKYELFQAGIRLHEAVNMSLDYMKLLQLPSSQKDYLTIDITEQIVESSKVESVKKAKQYKSMRVKVKKLSKQDQELRKWRKNKLFSFYDTLSSPIERRNLWSYGKLSLHEIVSGLEELICYYSIFA
ncbi:hypothetical protein O181_019280 [Austropuccinia psidii MF-1]|uniref:Uncharacterized protein n=1 Tax=Austropuccinia psidii MF-1 TaxID=1389203 RepID=A0A9Q3CBH5_9BASI|nr:hypothetical protein [Austropuccinia psidii MF-1]